MTKPIKIDLIAVANSIERRLTKKQFHLFEEDDIHRDIAYDNDGLINAKYHCFGRYRLSLFNVYFRLYDDETGYPLYVEGATIRFTDEPKNPSLELKDTDVLVEVNGIERAIDKRMMHLLIQLGATDLDNNPIPVKDKPCVDDLIQKRLSKQMKPININLPYAAAVLSEPFSFKAGSDNERTIHGMNVMQSTDFEQLDCYVTYDLPEDWRLEIRMAEYGGRQYSLFKDRFLFLEDDLDGSDAILYYKEYKEQDTHVNVSWEEHPDEDTLEKMPKPLFELLIIGEDN